MTDQQTAPAVPADPDRGDGQDFVSPSTLHFDTANPRFVEGGLESEEEIIQYLYDEADVDELNQSILSAGYIDFEPMIEMMAAMRASMSGNGEAPSKADLTKAKREFTKKTKSRPQGQEKRGQCKGHRRHARRSQAPQVQG